MNTPQFKNTKTDLMPTTPVAVESNTSKELLTTQQMAMLAELAHEYQPIILQKLFPNGVPPEIDVVSIGHTKTVPANAFTVVQVLVTYELRGRLNKRYNVLQTIGDLGHFEDGDSLVEEVNQLFSFGNVMRIVVQPDIEENDRFSSVGVVRSGKEEAVTIHSVRYRLFCADTVSIKNGQATIHTTFVPTPNLKDKWLMAKPGKGSGNRLDAPFRTKSNTPLGRYLLGVCRR